MQAVDVQYSERIVTTQTLVSISNSFIWDNAILKKVKVFALRSSRGTWQYSFQQFLTRDKLKMPITDL